MISKPSNTVCIVGLAPSRELAFAEPPGTEMWCLNQGHAMFTPEQMARFTAWFQVHPWDEMVARQLRAPGLNHLEWLKTTSIPVYLEELHPQDCPAGVRYPYEDVCADLGTDYLTSEVAFMLALAIHQRYELIKVYGVDMAHGTEYLDQRNCVEYLAGIAKGRGIEVWVPETCPLFKGQRYAKTVNIPSSRVATLMAQLTHERADLKDEANGLFLSMKFAQELLADPQLQGESRNVIGQRYENLLTRYKQALARYHTKMGAEGLCEQLLVEALKGVPVDLEAIAREAAGQGTQEHPEIIPPVPVPAPEVISHDNLHLREVLAGNRP